MPMSTEEWRRQVAASRPPLTPEQLAVLRPICQRMAQHAETEAAPARQQEPPHPVTTEQERNTA